MANTDVDPDTLHWTEAEGGYSLALSGKKLLCRNKKGKLLASVPSKVRKGETAKTLLDLRDWLAEHRKSCRERVETWMLRSLPIPRGVIQSVWCDPNWRVLLENAVVAPVALENAPDLDDGGFLRGVDPERGVGVVNLDGETEWLDTELVVLPHPILLPELDDARELLTELGLQQGIDQLFRETFPKPTDAEKLKKSYLHEFSGGRFEMLSHVVGRSRARGYRVRGGFAVCPTWEGGQPMEARYWVGLGDSYDDVWTGELLWIDAKEEVVELAQVGAVAYSEGVRMASAIYAGRAVEKEGE